MCWQILGCVKPLDFLSPINQDSCVRMSSKKMARHFFHRTILTLPLAQIIRNRFWYSSRHEKSVKGKKGSYILFVQTFHFLALYAGRGGGYSLQWPIRGGSERDIFFRLQVWERVGILLVEVYERVGKFVVSVCKKKAQMMNFMAVKKVEKTLWFSDQWFIVIKRRCIYSS